MQFILLLLPLLLLDGSSASAELEECVIPDEDHTMLKRDVFLHGESKHERNMLVCNILKKMQAEIDLLKTQVAADRASITQLQNVQGQIVNLTSQDLTQQALIAQFQDSITALNGAVAGLQNNTHDPVAFSVFRSTTFTNSGNTITYEGTLVNSAGAMNPSNGIFTAPVPGVYYFSASVHLRTNSFGNQVVLLVNGVTKALAAHNVANTDITVTLSQMLQLAQGDQVSLSMKAVQAFDATSNFATQFNGMLIQKAP